MVQNLNKHKVAKHFQKSIETYDSAATIQQELAGQLVAGIYNNCRNEFDRGLEVGCGTGSLTIPLIENIKINELFINDLVFDFEAKIKGKISHIQDVKIQPLFGDIEHIEIPKNLDIIVSSSTLQWLNDQNMFLNSIEEYLNPDGVIALSFFTKGTLAELRDVIQVGLAYLTEAEITSALSTKFDIVFSRTTTHTSLHPSLLSLLHNLKATGVGGVGEYHWTKGKLLCAEKQYIEKFGGAGGLPVTYENIAVIGKRK